MVRASDDTARRLRWEAADEPRPQGELFAPPSDRVRHPEFRDLEFIHVRAKSIINEVPKISRMPFRYTINVYRGCSHACSYCLVGETDIQMADGTTKPLADVRTGDRVYGTVRAGRYRRYVTTEVVDHWRTAKAAYRIALADGTELIASGDHRFLTPTGWKHVTGSQHGPGQRPHLTPGDSLTGFGAFTRKRTIPEGYAVKCVVDLRVVAVEPLGIELPMYDLTTGTGDFIANGVVSHNCFARPTHEYLNLDAGRDFERVIVVKVNAVELLDRELRRGRNGGEHIAMGTNTDPYQRCEGRYGLTRSVVATLGAAGNPFSILTKSALILRDLDLLLAAAERTDVGVSFSVGTLDTDVWRATEPGTPHPKKRVEAIAELAEAGMAPGVLVAPIIPGISDSRAQLRQTVAACLEAGARSVTPIVLHLRPGVKEQFMPWLEQHRPDLLERYRALYPHSYAPKDEQSRIVAIFDELVRELGGPRRVRASTARQVRTRDARSAPPEEGADQLRLL